MRWLFVSLLTLVLAAGACCSTTSEPSGTPPFGEGEGSPAPAGPNYSIEVGAPEKVSVGTEATAKVVVTPKNGFKINLEYPSKLVLKVVPPGAKVPSARITKRDMQAVEKSLTVPIRFTAGAAGENRFEGELRFSVCNLQTCQMPRETVAFATVAEGTAPAPTGDGGPSTPPSDEGATAGAGDEASATGAEGSE